MQEFINENKVRMSDEECNRLLQKLFKLNEDIAKEKNYFESIKNQKNLKIKQGNSKNRLHTLCLRKTNLKTLFEDKCKDQTNESDNQGVINREK